MFLLTADTELTHKSDKKKEYAGYISGQVLRCPAIVINNPDSWFFGVYGFPRPEYDGKYNELKVDLGNYQYNAEKHGGQKDDQVYILGRMKQPSVTALCADTICETPHPKLVRAAGSGIQQPPPEMELEWELFTTGKPISAWPTVM